MKTAIVIPAYNERENLKKLIPKIFFFVPKALVVVVDDNSPDGTGQAVRVLHKKYPQLKLMLRKRKSGRGSAVIAGLKFVLQNYSAVKIFVEMDADLSHDPQELPAIIARSKPKTIVFGSRYVKGSQIINWPWQRIIMSKLANFLIHLVLNLPPKDNTNGYRCYHRNAALILVNHKYLSRGYILLSESAKLLHDRGYEFIELPSTFHNRRLAKSNTTVFEFLDALINLLRIRLSKGWFRNL